MAECESATVAVVERRIRIERLHGDGIEWRERGFWRDRIPPDADAPPTLDDLRAHLRGAGMATQFWPEHLLVVDAPPRTATGKRRKHVLRADGADSVGATSNATLESS